MARTSMVVNATNVFEWYYNKQREAANWGQWYREVDGDYVLSADSSYSDRGLLVVPADLKATLGNKVIYSVDLVPSIIANASVYAIQGFRLQSPLPTLNPGNEYTKCTLYETNPCWYYLLSHARYSTQTEITLTESNRSPSTASNKEVSKFACGILQDRTVLYKAGYNELVQFYKTKANGNALQFVVYYDDTDVAQSIFNVVNGPKSGYYNPREVINVSWECVLDENETNYFCLDKSYAVSQATLYWKAASDESYYSISLPTNTNSYAIPENTFTTGTTIEWYITGTDIYNQTTSTPHYTFSTTANPIIVSNLTPANTIEDYASPITFKWQISSADNFPASRVILEYKSPTDNDWTEIVDVYEQITEYTTESYALVSAGEKQWRVTAYNVDGIAGVPAIASFIAIGAPTQPTVFTNGKPFTTITWQADGQQSYEIQIGNKVYGPYFGTEKEYTIPDYLPDGNYTVKVRVLGVYGLWSDWGIADYTVENTSTALFDLNCLANVDAELSWNVEEDDSDYIVYRDGKQIGHTSLSNYSDRVALGTHDYYVISKLSTGYYKKSKTVVRTESVDCLYVAMLDGGEWVKVEHRTKNEPTFKVEKSVSYNHITGHIYPVADYYDYEDVNAEYSAVFLYNEEDERKRFASMFGKPVILKTPDDTVVIGIMEGWERQNKAQKLTTYSFTIRRFDWSDYIDVS